MDISYTAVLNAALKTPLVRYIGFSKEQTPERMQCANAFLFLVMHERKNGKREPYHSRAVLHLKNLIKSGNEPGIDAVQIWAYPATACAITLCKHTPDIWYELTDEEIERLDLLMTAFGLISNFIGNDANEYQTGISLRGDVRKQRPPNFRFPLIIPGIAAAHYFGGSDKLDEILTGFDYDAFIVKAQTFGFNNLLKIWQTPGFEHNGITYPGAKELLTTDGSAYIVSKMPMDYGNVYRGGKGKGAMIPYLYHGCRAGSAEIVNDLVLFNHSAGAIKSTAGDNGDGTFVCYIIDGSASPMEGKDGLMYEYDTEDSEGVRSDAHYCQMDFSMEIALLLMAKELGIWSEDNNAELYKKIYAGNEDNLYKLSVGYMSQGMGMQRIEVETNLRGYFFTKTLWKSLFPEIEV